MPSRKKGRPEAPLNRFDINYSVTTLTLTASQLVE